MENKTFEEKLERVEEISNLMEENKITLDESVKLYDEASALIKGLKEELGKASEKVKILVSNEEAVLNDFEEV